MPLVMDASAIVPLAMPDEDGTYAQASIDEVLKGGGLAPMLLWYEIRNVLIQAERRGRIEESQASSFLTSLERLPLALDNTPNSDGVLELSRKHSLSVYDASYLELAIRSEQPLATQDKALRKAARRAGVTVFAD